MTEGARGLSTERAQALYRQNGANELSGGKRRSALVSFLLQFKDILILILAVAVCFSLAVGEYVEAISIIAIMLLNAFMGFIQERRCERTLAALKALSSPTASVIRDGQEKRIAASHVVVGDVCVLRAGDRVPADMTVFEENRLECDESLLTGESHPIKKSVGDKAFCGSNVLAGRAAGEVVAVGMQTEMGKIADMLSAIEEKRTPLQERLRGLGRVIALICVGICALTTVVGAAMGEGLLDMLLVGLSLAVAAIPEGLPAVVTVVLALSVGRILKKGTIIRKLHAVETLGCASVICCDKTGTLTQNKMSVKKIVPISGASERETLCAALIASSPIDAKRLSRKAAYASPTEAAIAVCAAKSSLTREQALCGRAVRDELPFDSRNKYMSVTLSDGSCYMKGAPDRLMAICKTSNPALERELLELTGEGLRVIAAAGGSPLALLGLIALEDPVRPQAAPAVRLCKKAGIRAVMITGDHRNTAVAVAKKTGIDASHVLDGAELDRMSERELCAAVAKTSVFARVSPAHKLSIVRALRKNGVTVAMTGDGVNDAPAVKEADIGVAMGVQGTDVTKEAASVVITDDNFATIVESVREGRIIYSNIKNFISYLLTCNLGEVLTVLFAMLCGSPLIFSPVQLLLINLITDGMPAIALGMERGERGIMEKPPRRKEEALFSNGLALSIVVRGAVLGAFNILCYLLVKRIEPTAASSAAYICLVLSQMLFVMEGRIRSIGSNPSLIAAVAGAIAATAVTVYIPPLAALFGTVAVGGIPLLIALGCAAVCCVFGKLIGLLLKR